MDFPIYKLPPPPVLTPFCIESLGLFTPVATLSPLGSIASTAWPTNNLAFFYPFRLYDWATAYQLLFWVGATSSGNIDVGIYDSQLNLIVGAGSTAMSATVNTVQELNIADTILPPGDYLLGVVCSTTAGTVFGSITADENILSSVPVYEQASALPLPNPCVPVMATGVNPFRAACGIQFRSIF